MDWKQAVFGIFTNGAVLFFLILYIRTLKQQFKALKGTVDAQKETIEAVEKRGKELDFWIDFHKKSIKELQGTFEKINEAKELLHEHENKLAVDKINDVTLQIESYSQNLEEITFAQQEKERRNEEIRQKASEYFSAMFSQEINTENLKNYLQQKFPTRHHCKAPVVNELAGRLTAADYKTIGGLDRALKFSSDAFLIFEKDNSSEDKTGPIYNDVRAVNISLRMFDEKFVKQINAGFVNQKYRALLKK